MPVEISKRSSERGRFRKAKRLICIVEAIIATLDTVERSYFALASMTLTVANEGGDAFSGVVPGTESKESGVALRDRVPVLDT